MRIGVAVGEYAQDIYGAINSLSGMAADFVDIETDPTPYGILVAVDDAPLPPAKNVRRYVTKQDTDAEEWAVVASRNLLREAVARGNQHPIAVALPTPACHLSQPAPSGVAIVGPDLGEQLTAALRAVKIELLHFENEDVGIVIDPSTSSRQSNLKLIRQCMSKERVIVAMQSNSTASDNIQNNSTGRLASGPEELIQIVRDLVHDDYERQRLGFEAKKFVASTSWSRVVRALLLGGRKGLPEFELLSQPVAKRRWDARLGHAHKWQTAKYGNGQLRLPEEHLDLGELGPLRATNLKKIIGEPDPRKAAP